MVLADGGLCCIDEFDGIRTEDMSALNEPMEQQTLSIAKAGITTKLHTRTTIFAVTNPKARPVAHHDALAVVIASLFDTDHTHSGHV